MVYIISVLSLCLTVCRSDDDDDKFRKHSRGKLILAHPVNVQGIRVEFVYEGHRVKSRRWRSQMAGIYSTREIRRFGQPVGWLVFGIQLTSRITIYLFIYLTSTWQRAGSDTYMPQSSRNMHIKVIHTKLDVTLKLNTTITKEAAISIWYIYRGWHYPKNIWTTIFTTKQSKGSLDESAGRNRRMPRLQNTWNIICRIGIIYGQTWIVPWHRRPLRKKFNVLRALAPGNVVKCFVH